MEKLSMEIDSLKIKMAGIVAENGRLRQVAKECANELCYRCGEYQREHLGACSGCRWLEVRHGNV